MSGDHRYDERHWHSQCARWQVIIAAAISRSAPLLQDPEVGVWLEDALGYPKVIRVWVRGRFAVDKVNPLDTRGLSIKSFSTSDEFDPEKDDLGTIVKRVTGKVMLLAPTE